MPKNPSELHISDIIKLIEEDLKFTENEAPPIVDPKLDYLKSVLNGEYDASDDEAVCRDLTEGGRNLYASLTNAKLKEFYRKNVWHTGLSFLYISEFRDYVFEHADEEDIDCDYLSSKFDELKKLVDTWEKTFSKMSYEEFSRAICLIFVLSNISEQVDEENINLVNNQERAEIIDYLKNRELTPSEEKSFLKKYADRVIFLYSFNGDLEEKIKTSSYGFRSNTLAFAIQQFKEFTSLDILQTIRIVSEDAKKHGGKGAYGSALALQNDLNTFRKFLNYVNLRDDGVDTRKKRRNAEAFLLGQDMTVFKMLEIVSKHVASEEARIKAYKAIKHSDIKKHRRAIQILMDFKEDSLIGVEEIKALLKAIVFEETRTTIMDWIGFHNDRIYQKAIDQYKKLSNDPKIKLIALLKEYNISVDDKTFERLKGLDINYVREIILTLKKHHLMSKHISFVLSFTNIDTVRIIDEYISSGWLAPSYVSRNIDIYNPDSETFKKYKELIEFLNSKEFRINPSIFMGMTNSIISSFELFKANLRALSIYGLIPSLKKTQPAQLMVVLDEDLVEKLDKIIESGCYEALTTDLSLLACSSNRFKRIDVMMGLNFPLNLDEDDDTFNIERVLNGRFFLGDQDLDDYIFRPVINEDDKSWAPELKDFEGFRLTSQSPVMKIGNYTFSYPKVKREMSKGKSFVEALFFGRSCTQGSYNDTMEEIKPLVKEYV